MKTSFKIRAIPDGTLGLGEAALSTNCPQLADCFDDPSGNAVHARIEGEDGCLVCRIVRLVHGAPEVRLPGSRFEPVRTNAMQEVEISRVEPVPADRVVVQAPASVSESEVIASIRGLPCCKGQRIALRNGVFAEIVEAEPEAEAWLCTHDTRVVREKTSHAAPIKSPGASFGPKLSVVGGLSREIARLREAVEWPLKYPKALQQMGVSDAPGVILYGPRGTGKSLLVKALCAEMGVSVWPISGPEVLDKFYGETERKLRKVFQDAAQHTPAVILIDELDSLAPRRGASQQEGAPSVVATLLTVMDGIRERRGVAVLATTNRLDAIDPALRREGRFSLEIPILPPSEEGRREILAILTTAMKLAGDVDLSELARKTHGFVGADLKALCKEAAMEVLRRRFASRPPNAAFAPSDVEVSHADFEAAAAKLKPSALREFQVEIPRVTWGDIGGLDDVKRLLTENVVLPLRKREEFKKFGLKPARGVLLHGPPGTGKTLLAKAVATECGVNFIPIKAGELLSKWLGESEANVRSLFEKARLVAPCVLFFDEIDALTPARGEGSGSSAHDGVVNALLTEMDGVQTSEGLFVMGATNRLNLVDPALLRPGRFDYKVEIPLPDPASRRQILTIHLGPAHPLLPGEQEALIQDTDGLSGAEIVEAVREAKMQAMREADYAADRARLTRSHLQTAIERVRSSAPAQKRRIGFST